MPTARAVRTPDALGASLGDRTVRLGMSSGVDAGRAICSPSNEKNSTPGAGLLTSFCLAVSASSFTWYAIRQGATLGGTDKTTVVLDIKALPGVVLGFF